MTGCNGQCQECRGGRCGGNTGDVCEGRHCDGENIVETRCNNGSCNNERVLTDCNDKGCRNNTCNECTSADDRCLGDFTFRKCENGRLRETTCVQSGGTIENGESGFCKTCQEPGRCVNASEDTACGSFGFCGGGGCQQPMPLPFSPPASYPPAFPKK